MADRSGLRLLGYVFGAITAVVMLTAGAVVYGHVGGRLVLDQGQSVTAAVSGVVQ